VARNFLHIAQTGVIVIIAERNARKFITSMYLKKTGKKMVKKTKIICKHCGKDTGYSIEDFMYCVIDYDIRCPHCKNIIIDSKPTPEYSENKS